MNKIEYESQRQDIIGRLGTPEYDFDRTPLNESAKELTRLLKAYRATTMAETRKRKKQEEMEKQGLSPLLDEKEQKQVVRQYKLSQAVPIELSEIDLVGFTKPERDIVTDYFHNMNLTPSELAREGFSAQRVVALMRSGPFTVLAAKVFDYLMPLEVRAACLKAVKDGDKKIIERFAEQTGVLKPQEQTINVNKPLELDAETMYKLKLLGDNA